MTFLDWELSDLRVGWLGFGMSKASLALTEKWDYVSDQVKATVHSGAEELRDISERRSSAIDHLYSHRLYQSAKHMIGTQ